MTSHIHDDLPQARAALSDYLALLLLGALWGASFLFMRVAAPEFGPVPLIAVRLVVACVLTTPLLLPNLRQPAVREALPALAVLGVFNSAVPFVLFAYAALALPAGFSAVLNASAAWWAAIFGWAWFGVAASRRALAGLLIGTAGVAVMVAHKLLDTSEASPAIGWAVLAALSATACYGACVHYARSRLADLPPRLVATGSVWAAALAVAVPGAWMWPQQAPSLPAWAAAAALGALSTALAYALYFRLVARIGPARVMTVTLLVPAFGVIFGVLLLDEPLSVGIAIGAALVVLGTGLALKPSTPTTSAG
jgi:drug/metabolite transporter (DMT)-like permease